MRTRRDQAAKQSYNWHLLGGTSPIKARVRDVRGSPSKELGGETGPRPTSSPRLRPAGDPLTNWWSITTQAHPASSLALTVSLNRSS